MDNLFKRQARGAGQLDAITFDWIPHLIRLDSSDCQEMVHMLYSTHIYILQEAVKIETIARTLLSNKTTQPRAT